MKYSGKEKRKGPPRRSKDRDLCAICGTLQTETKEHREMVCQKIGKKADMALVSILVVLGIAVVGGGMVWLKSDIATVRTDAVTAVKNTDANIAKGFEKIENRMVDQNTKIDAHADIRIRNDNEQLQKLVFIEGQLRTMDYRLLQLENIHQPAKGTK